MPQKRVSIIIPVHNGEDCLPRAVDSILAQTWKEKELILVDDGSSDRTGQYIDQCSQNNAWVRSVHLDADRGVSAARNAGMAIATGDYVTFLDADDAMAPTLLERLCQLQEDTRSDICGCQFQRITVTPKEAGNEASGGGCVAPEDVSKRSGKSFSAPGSAPSVHTCRGSRIVEKCILTDHDTRVWSKLFTRRVLLGHTFKEDLSIGEDMLFFLSLLKTETTYSLTDESLYFYTVNPEGAMEKPFTPSYMDQLRCWEEAQKTIRAAFPALLEKEENAARLAALQTVSAILTASKIAKLPTEKQQAYSSYFAKCRKAAAAYGKVAGAKKYFPGGYRIKRALLLYFPGIYVRCYKK